MESEISYEKFEVDGSCYVLKVLVGNYHAHFTFAKQNEGTWVYFDGTMVLYFLTQLFLVSDYTLQCHSGKIKVIQVPIYIKCIRVMHQKGGSKRQLFIDKLNA